MGAIKDLIDLITQLSNSVKDRNIATELNNIQSLISKIQSEHAGLYETNIKLRDEISSLKDKIKNFEDWNDISSKYELKEFSGEVYAYTLKSSIESNAPKHWLCPNCFVDKKLSILQFESNVMKGKLYKCPKCNAELWKHSK